MRYTVRLACVIVWAALVLGSSGCSKTNSVSNPSTEKQTEAPRVVTDTKPTDADLLQGTWKVESIEFDGKKDGDTENLAFLFRGNEVMIRDRPDTDNYEPFQLDQTRRPKTIDIGKPDPKKSGLTPGIYELNGDRLTICFVKEANAMRPTAFESKPGTQTVLIALTRDTTAPPIPNEIEPNFAEFPAAIVGKWTFSQGRTELGYFAPDTEFTKDGRVLQLDRGSKKWDEKYTYKFRQRRTRANASQTDTRRPNRTALHNREHHRRRHRCQIARRGCSSD